MSKQKIPTKEEMEASRMMTVINAPRPISFRAQLIELWFNESTKIRQIGLLRDLGGTITKFVKWETATAPDMQMGGTYDLYDVVAERWGGKWYVKINQASDVEQVDG